MRMSNFESRLNTMEKMMKYFDEFIHLKEEEKMNNLTSLEISSAIPSNINDLIKKINKLENEVNEIKKQKQLSEMQNAKKIEDLKNKINYLQQVINNNKLNIDINKNNLFERNNNMSNDNNNSKMLKLNISNFIGEKEINKSVKNAFLKVNVKNKKIYREYEIYVLEVQNLTDKEILLDSGENTKTTYLQGSNETKDYSLLYENTKAELTIPAGVEKTINITFSKQYNSDNSSKYLVFSDVIRDNSEYSKLKNKSDYKDRGNCVISL